MYKMRYLVFAAVAGFLVLFGRTEITFPQAEGAPIFAPVDAPYVVTSPNPALTSEVPTTGLTSDLIASSSDYKLGSALTPWSDVYAIFGRFLGVVTDTVSSPGALSLASGGTNQNISLTPSGTGTVNIGGNSIVVASKASAPSSPTTGQIYFDTAAKKFRGYTGTNWVDLSEALIPRHTITAIGNAQVDTAVKQFGTGSLLLDGVGDYLTVPASSDWNFSSATDFTIDFWFYLDDKTRDAQTLLDTFDNGSGWMIAYRWDAGQAQSLIQTHDGPNNVFTNITINNATWYHLAVVRGGSTLKLYLDGIAQATLTNGDWAGQANKLYIGRNNSEIAGGASDELDGQLDEVRVLKGVAAWTSNFIPPTEAHNANSNTVLLLHMDGVDGAQDFIDAATAN